MPASSFGDTEALLAALRHVLSVLGDVGAIWQRYHSSSSSSSGRAERGTHLDPRLPLAQLGEAAVKAVASILAWWRDPRWLQPLCRNHHCALAVTLSLALQVQVRGGRTTRQLPCACASPQSAHWAPLKPQQFCVRSRPPHELLQVKLARALGNNWACWGFHGPEIVVELSYCLSTALYLTSDAFNPRPSGGSVPPGQCRDGSCSARCGHSSKLGWATFAFPCRVAAGLVPVLGTLGILAKVGRLNPLSFQPLVSFPVD